MPLIVEDGTMPQGANSYISIAFMRQFATDRGVDLSAKSDAQVTAMILPTTDYLENLRDRYVGCVATDTQSLQFPRQGIILPNGTPLPSSGPGSIPSDLQNGQGQLVLEVNNGVDLLPTIDNNKTGGFIVRRKTDVLEKEFSEKIGTSKQPYMPKVMRWLSTLLKPSVALKVVRV